MPSDIPAARRVLGEPTPLVDSVIWELQRSAYEQMGTTGWQSGVVPQWVTTNPVVAEAYAKVVVGLFRDLDASAARLDREPDQPIYIVELGAGSGRFAYNFVRILSDLLGRARLESRSFRYICTDLAEKNIQSWMRHPLMAEHIDRGVVDFARFDVAHEDALQLRISGATLRAGDIRRPLVVIANYLFDSVPSDVFRSTEQGLTRGMCTVSVSAEGGEDGPLTGLDIAVDYEPVGETVYGEENLDRFVHSYCEDLVGATVSVPVVALSCLDRLARLAADRMLLLAGDKAFTRRADVAEGMGDPQAALHGSVFSLMVNFHAMGSWFERRGGLQLHPWSRESDVAFSAFAAGLPADALVDTVAAYHDAFRTHSPDDLSVIFESFQAQAPITLRSAIGILRTFGHDSRWLGMLLPGIMRASARMDMTLREDLVRAVWHAWANTYPIGEEGDRSLAMGLLLFELKFRAAMPEGAEATAYLESSMERYARDAPTLFDRALCDYISGDLDGADGWASEALAADPGFAPARQLLVRTEIDRAH
jgi:hypothetical protein